MSDTGDERLDRGTLIALAAMSLGVFLVANDFTALSVALPDIERDFDSDLGAVQWVINGYALVFGVLIVTGGRLCDLYGRRKLFFWGAGIFAVFSAVAAIAPSLPVLLAARAPMGVGGAIMWPAVLGMTFAALPAAKAGLAGGLVLGVAGLGNAVGPLLGGVLTETLGWRWVFVVNLPVAAIAVLATWRYIHQPFQRDARDRIDVAGVVALTVSLVALLVALDEVTELGWGDARILALLAGFAVALIAFVVVERRAGRNALVPRRGDRRPRVRRLLRRPAVHGRSVLRRAALPAAAVPEGVRPSADHGRALPVADDGDVHGDVVRCRRAVRPARRQADRDQWRRAHHRRRRAAVVPPG